MDLSSLTAQLRRGSSWPSPKVTAVTVTDLYPTGPYGPIPWPADIERYEAAAATSAKQILNKVSVAAQGLGVPCTTQHVADCRPAEGILATCQERACDLIVMSTHGRSGLSKLMLGSQASKVITLSSVPVLVCRAQCA
jgi:nucleotide-binding universal stress UspA family protein